MEENRQSLGERVLEIGRELAILEEKLQTPSRTTDDILRHMQLVRQLRSLKADY